MRRFNREGRSGDGESRRFGRRDSGSFGGRAGGKRSDRSFGGRNSGRRPLEMHKVICDKCGQECEVPFKPTSSKPVYCNDCFRKGENFESRKPSQYSNRPSGKFESDKPDKYKKEFEQINEKLDRILQALELD
jgi:CxxC-x17-CxxC domain-containing protein